MPWSRLESAPLASRPSATAKKNPSAWKKTKPVGSRTAAATSSIRSKRWRRFLFLKHPCHPEPRVFAAKDLCGLSARCVDPSARGECGTQDDEEESPVLSKAT